ncbi:uncharacterized protein LOC132944507 [Metopolophium dirhodum]|uniref:uncharacterized protein LOC132944507 n=1 Tax=Metopolophium dirhodum TaxID=44670 RepID=UPI00298F75C2|nr:uncharacterized protein LOC132944507 [Metopolophium dirhodum]XP_060869867.1 uncharacterized protein LOC132944507 [Metopolophium dirhodum]
MKERYRKQKFLKNVGLQPFKIQRPMEEEHDTNICERVCFYYFDDESQVICRGCYKSFKTWLNFRLHFNTLSCHTTQTNYKLNTYNDVYKKYKLKKAKTKKKMNNRLSAAQLMDLETLNTRKTRKRCYQNTRVVVTASKSSSDSGSINSEKATVKTLKKEAVEIDISSDESVEESKTKPNGCDTIEVQDIPSSSKIIIPNSPHDNQTTLTVKTEWNADDLSLVSSDDHSSSSAHCPPKYSPPKNKALKYQYVCVICDAQFMSKCSLTMHQVQHIKSDRSSYSVFMAALTQSARV